MSRESRRLARRTFSGVINDDHAFDNEWCFRFDGFCEDCCQQIVQKIRFPKAQPSDGSECEKPKDQDVERELRYALQRNHICKTDIVDVNGQRFDRKLMRPKLITPGGRSIDIIGGRA